MTDRARELAEALLDNPWIEPSIKRVCRELVEKWAKEDATPAAFGEKVNPHD